MNTNYNKFKKLIKNPGLFFRDYLLKKHPLYYNELQCALQEEQIIIENDLSLERQIPSELPIDVVYTWVNHNDNIWKNKYLSYKKNDYSYGQNATDLSRFSNNNELYFSLKSIKKFIPWVRKIYIITDNQTPEWIDLYSNVTIIDHRDIIPKEYLPTFNSHVIEAYLHKIKDLSEYFLYFNDDVFVSREIPKSHFFKSNGISSLFITKKSINAMRDKGINTPTLHACLNSRELLYDEFYIEIDTPLVHSYIPLRKNLYNEVFNKFHAEISAFSENKFRTNHDLNMATFLVPWYSYLKGYSAPYKDICYYFNIRSATAQQIYKQLKQSNIMPHSICANDISQKGCSNINMQNEELNKTLSKIFGG